MFKFMVEQNYIPINNNTKEICIDCYKYDGKKVQIEQIYLINNSLYLTQKEGDLCLEFKQPEGLFDMALGI